MNFKSTLALAFIAGAAYLALPNSADAQPQCNAPTVYGIACHSCFNPGSQICCPSGQIIPAGQFCPAIPGHGPPPPPPPPPPHNTSSGGSGSMPSGASIGCTANVLCPTASTITLTRVPIAPTGWTAGVNGTGHPTKIADENADRMVGGTIESGNLTCMYGAGAAIASVQRQRTIGSQKCTEISSYGDGFCCNTP